MKLAMKTVINATVCLTLPIMLSACAGFSRDGGLDEVRSLTHKDVRVHSASDAGLQQQSQDLLAQPLGVDEAVQYALWNHKGLQADIAALGIAEADLVQAGRLPNPGFNMLYTRNNGEYKIEQVFGFNILAFATMPMAKAAEQRHFDAAKQRLSLQVLQLAQSVRQAWVEAVAAEQSLIYAQQVMQSAEAAAELARRMHAQGNWSKLEQAREQSFYADAALDFAHARDLQMQSREHLSRLLGLGDSARFRLPQRLPDLPQAETELLQVEQQAFSQRLDLQARKLELQALAKQLGLTRATRFINVLEIGPARVLEGRRGEAYKKGVALGFELPIFDSGAARVKRAEAVYSQALEATAQATVDAESEVRLAYQQYRLRHEMATHYQQEIVPVRQRILQESQLRYNGMLLSAFELLSEARGQIHSVNQYINALRDFWLAEAALTMSMQGPASMSPSAQASSGRGE